jgi:hypothetical protein
VLLEDYRSVIPIYIRNWQKLDVPSNSIPEHIAAAIAVNKKVIKLLQFFTGSERGDNFDSFP